MDFQILISFVFATLALAISPGPDNIFVLIQSATYGRKSGLAVVAGLMSGCLIHTGIVALGLSAFIESNDYLYFFLKFFGSAYMFYLAAKVYNSDIKTNKYSKENKCIKNFELFKQGFIMNVINPKVSIFFIAFFPAFLFSEELELFKQFIALGFIFVITSFFVFCFYVFLSTFFVKLIFRSKYRLLVLNRIQIFVFVVIAITILIN